MRVSEDFYMQHVRQVRLDLWSSGLVTVVGDAGYSPSLFTGIGASIAIIEEYVLAGEISRRLNNIPAALESYERILHPLTESIQKPPAGIP
jgi:2-polyprenyl-6-methoxyphenol hydroxylase-like FAD-dependent oxidoreductase